LHFKYLCSYLSTMTEVLPRCFLDFSIRKVFEHLLLYRIEDNENFGNCLHLPYFLRLWLENSSSQSLPIQYSFASRERNLESWGSWQVVNWMFENSSLYWRGVDMEVMLCNAEIVEQAQTHSSFLEYMDYRRVGSFSNFDQSYI
jgi:hypothetical protein